MATTANRVTLMTTEQWARRGASRQHHHRTTKQCMSISCSLSTVIPAPTPSGHIQLTLYNVSYKHDHISTNLPPDWLLLHSLQQTTMTSCLTFMYCKGMHELDLLVRSLSSPSTASGSRFCRTRAGQRWPEMSRQLLAH